METVRDDETSGTVERRERLRSRRGETQEKLPIRIDADANDLVDPPEERNDLTCDHRLAALPLRTRDTVEFEDLEIREGERSAFDGRSFGVEGEFDAEGPSALVEQGSLGPQRRTGPYQLTKLVVAPGGTSLEASRGLSRERRPHAFDEFRWPNRTCDERTGRAIHVVASAVIAHRSEKDDRHVGTSEFSAYPVERHQARRRFARDDQVGGLFGRHRRLLDRSRRSRRRRNRFDGAPPG